MANIPKRPKRLEAILTELQKNQNYQYAFENKITWLYLLNNGIWPCDPQFLNDKIKTILSLDEYQPRGKKLLYLRPRDSFTLMPSGKPGRPEEALERLIVGANHGMCDQMPIGGGKESVDIVKLENGTATFIELKPWRTSDSPLYALLEGLKNLFLYRILKAKDHKGCQTIQKVQVAILAPFLYYQNFQLLDHSLKIPNKNNVQAFIDAVAKIFEVKIQFIALNWTEEDLLKVCSDISPGPNNEKEIISVAGYPAIEALKEENWIKLIAS